MRDIVRLGTRLLLLALVAGLLLGVTNEVTKGPIAQGEIQAAKEAREKAFTGAQIEPLDTLEWSQDEYPNVLDVSRAMVDGKAAGYVVNITGSGYGGNIAVMVGVRNDGTIAAVVVGDNNETPGLGKNAQREQFTAQYAGKTPPLGVKKGGGAGKDEVDALTGATITTRAVTEAVNTACKLAMALAGGGAQ